MVDDLNARYGLEFYFQNPSLRNTLINGILVKKHFFDYLEDTFLDISVLRYNENIYLIMEGSMRNALRTETGQLNVFFMNDKAEEVKGIVRSGADYSPVADAAIILTGTNRGTITKADGSFSLRVDKELNIVELKHPGMLKSFFAFIKRPGETSNSFEIEVDAKENFLDELIVTAQKPDANVSDHRSGIDRMSIKTIKQIPTFLGEIDPIRSITTLPGVTSSGDLGAGFNVRGGETSQNLILQDGAVIFNPSHLFGFFSSFNPDVIRSVELIKGCGPASYGGRVASVLDLQTRNGDLNKLKVNGGIGLVSSRLSVETPIKRGRSSVLISGRSSYSDWLIHKYNNIELQNSSSKFSDLTGKLFFSLGESNALSITGYRSFDSFKFDVSSIYSWSTENLSATYHHEFGKKLNADITAARSDYKSGEDNPDELFGYTNKNRVLVTSANLRLNHEVSEKFRWYGGLSSSLYQVTPGSSVPFGDISQWEAVSIDFQKGLESAAFVEGAWELTSRLGMDGGLRYSLFNRLGPGNIYTLNYAERDGRLPAISDSTSFGDNELIHTTGGFEPRVSFRYKLAENSSLKMGYTRTQQFIQQVSPTISPSPIDYWVLASNNLKPQKSNQFSFGLFSNFAENRIETSVEFFYNKTQNALDYLDGVDLKLNPTYERGLAQGLGEAYGMELFLKKRGGNFNGWISYTLSRSWRIFKSEFPGQEINNGKRYPSTFDQPNQLSVVANLKLPHRWEMSGNITYNSGRPITIPVSKYSYADLLAINNYSGRNSYRSPDYFRVDLSVTLNGKHLEDQFFSGDFIFSLYNALGRKNAYAIWFDNLGQAFKTSVLGAAFPSLTYTFSIN